MKKGLGVLNWGFVRQRENEVPYIEEQREEVEEEKNKN